ncbi:MAG: hypothetical protein K2K57_04770 [Oscillospiraceae bacterium]|nr:hypothetical protein [Oscillospiraceae bacterium]
MRRRREAAVELTPLLDVILIMLFLIMSQSRTEAAEARERYENEAAEFAAAAEERYGSEIDRLTDELADSSEELEKVRESLYYADNRVNAYEKFDYYARIVSISLRGTGEEREIYLADGKRTVNIPLNWDNMRYCENAFRAELMEYENSEEPVFLVFGYNAGEVYQRDFEMVSAVMSEIQGDNQNVYIKYNEIKVESE